LASPNKRLAWETIPPLLDRASPLRTAHLRDPVGPQIQFSSESFMDESAAPLGVTGRARVFEAELQWPLSRMPTGRITAPPIQ
jgi:hypothetical protein